MSCVESYNPIFEEMFFPHPELEKILSGFRFLEGPAWHTPSSSLFFSDIKGNAIYRWYDSVKLEIVRDNSYLANGNAFDADWNFYTCEHGTSRVSRTDTQGNYEILVSQYKGKGLNSPNDIVVKSDGTVYFTDPPSGRSEKYGIPREQELDFQGVYRYDPADNSLILLVDDFAFPNGLSFSPDESLLYVNDTRKQHIRVFRLKDDGTLDEGGLFTELIQDAPGVADGMKVDGLGFLYTTGPGGIQVFAEDSAELAGRISIPEQAANFCWGGPEGKDLLITASTSLYRLRTRRPISEQ